MKPLIPIYEAVIQTRSRRIITPNGLNGWFHYSYNANGIEKNVRCLHIWINEFTTGRFYLSRIKVAFENEKDFIIFKLWFKELE